MNAITITATAAAPTTLKAKNNATKSKQFSQVLNQPSASETATKHVANFVDGMIGDEKKLETAMVQMRSGREIDAVQLLRTQSLVYGYAQRVDLASKIVESATSGLKQLLNTRV